MSSSNSSQSSSTPDQEQTPLAPLFKRAWREYLSHHKGLLVFAAILMVIDGGSIGALSYFVKPMIDDVFVAANHDMIWPIAGIMFSIFFARAISSYGQRCLTNYVGLRFITDIQQNLSRHLLTLDNAFFHSHPPGELIDRVRGDSQALQSAASTTVITIGRDAFSLISLITVAALIDWKWTLTAFIGIPMIAVPMKLAQKRVARSTRFARAASANMSVRLDEIFHGFKAIKSNRMENFESNRIDDATEDFRRRQFQSERGKALMPSLMDIVSGLAFVAIMVLGGGEIVDGEKTLGDFMSFFAALAILFDPLRRLALVSGHMQAAGVSLQRLFQLFELKPTIVDSADAQPLNNPQGDIRFSNVEFAYLSNDPVLRGISFVAPAGKTTAFVGASGAGKSTLFNLLSRFEDIQTGEISIGNQAIHQATLASLRDNLALVTQETSLFDDTIRHNIAYGRLDAEAHEIETAAEIAFVTEFAQSLPLGLDTPCGPRGSNLSGGQRQRVVIARALLRNAPILLLDEATSALDNHTEQRIQQALERTSEGKTTLVIAHRLSTVQNADLIHLVHDGRVLESGSHEELLAKGGRYAAICQDLEQQPDAES